ncbi:hypothetical protein [Nocardia cyriacigeorgica]|uniref:hypothetical protein n=1 Tax=Nocardia cyriacigeorgica TaxID=135487 RepID=UPI001895BE05|nr:hypothetical protein [Nocardia cyriacigeorgica]MBF6416972.1 hypothetical protein [Nocardia cyriacigeorgica]
MGLIWQRKRPTGPDSGEPVVSSLSGLTAASAPIAPERWGKITKPASGDAGKWAAEAWDMLDLVGELSFALLWKQALLSRFRLVASDIDPDTGRPTGNTTNVAAQQLVARIAGGVAGQSQLLARLAPLMMIPGEAWLAIIYPGGVEQWHVLSTDEVKTKGTDVELLLQDGSKYLMDKSNDTLSRIWRPDPRRSWLAWSPTKAALPILRRIVRMDQNIEGAGKSRQAGNGILVIPTEASMPVQTAPTGDKVDSDAPNLPPPAASRFVTAGEVHQALMKAMSTAIENPSSAEALVPIVLQVAGQWVDKIRHIRFDSEVSEKAQAAQEKAIRRLAMTLDMPPEVLLGLADLNHWSLWGVEEEAVRWHAAPEMEVICQALTNELLRPILGDTAADVVIWYDTTDVEAKPDQLEQTRDGFDRGVVNADAYLREIGLSTEDAGYDLTTRDGWAAWATDQVRRDATLVPVLAPILRVLVPALADLQIAAPTPAPAPEPEREPEAIEAAPRGTPDTRDEQPAVTASAVTRLCVNRALELAGKRRRGRADHARLRDVPARDTHLAAHLGPVAAADVDRLIDGWDDVLDDELCAGIGFTRPQIAAAVRETARTVLTTGSLPPWRTR